MRQDGDERVLAQKSALSRHVGSGEQPEPLTFLELAVIADESCRVSGFERCLDHRMPSACHGEGKAVIHDRPAIALGDGQLGESGGDIETRQRGRRTRDFAGARLRLGDGILEKLLLQGDGAFCRRRYLALEFAEFHGRVPHGVGQCLTVDEAVAQFLAMRCRDLDEIAENVVVTNLERCDARRGGITRLQVGDHAPALVTQHPELVELGRITRRHEAAIPRDRRQIDSEHAP